MDQGKVVSSGEGSERIHMEIRYRNIHYSLLVTEGDTKPGRTRQKPKDVSTCESEDRGSGEGRSLFIIK